jgi:exodeoxyribonuclease VII large subunit
MIMVILSVSALHDKIKQLFYTNLSDFVKVKGEITNLKLSKGHLYLTLKDEDSNLQVVCWNYNKIKNQKIINTINSLKDGHKIIISGKIVTHYINSSYQLLAYDFNIIGTGDQHNDMVLLKEYYTELGYFNNNIKKSLPPSINNIGLLTAKEGAAIKDFMYVLEKGKYFGKIYFMDTIVQGSQCPKSVSDNIAKLDAMNLDVIIITRGGGSFEDLNGFSHADIIEAIYKANTCIISAIGHEIDYTLSDYVSDIRAPTPSVAAEILVSHQHNIFGYDINTSSTIRSKLDSTYLTHKNKLTIYSTKINDYFHLAIKSMKSDIYSYSNHITNNLNNIFKDKNNEIDMLLSKLNNANPTTKFNNGYVVLLDNNNNKITSSKMLQSCISNSTNNSNHFKLLFKNEIINISISISK